MECRPGGICCILVHLTCFSEPPHTLSLTLSCVCHRSFQNIVPMSLCYTQPDVMWTLCVSWRRLTEKRCRNSSSFLASHGSGDERDVSCSCSNLRDVRPVRIWILYLSSNKPLPLQSPHATRTRAINYQYFAYTYILSEEIFAGSPGSLRVSLSLRSVQ